MKRLSCLIALVVVIHLATAMAATVNNIDVSYRDGSTVVKIAVNGTVRFSHQTEIPKDGRPDRIIVDVLSATHDLGAKEFANLPNCPVSGIRTSQFAVSPERIVRLVLDLTKSPIYRIESDTRSISVVISDKHTAPFASWSSGSVVKRAPKPPAKKAAVASTGSRATASPSAKAKVASQNEQINNDRLVSLGSIAAKPTTTVPKPSTGKKSMISKTDPASKSKSDKASKSRTPSIAPGKKLVNTKTSEKGPGVPAEPSLNSDRNAAARSWLATTGNSPEAKTTSAKSSPAPGSEKKKKSSSLASKTPPVPAAKLASNAKPAAKKSAVVAKAGATENKKSTEAQLKLAASAPDKTTPNKAAISNSGSPKTATKAGVKLDKKKSMFANSVKTKSSSSKQIAKAPVKKKRSKKSTVASAPSTSKKSKASAGKVKKSSAAATISKKSSNKKKSLASASSKRTKAKPGRKSKTSRFRRAASNQKLKRTMVAQFPKRLVIKYRSRGRRDPFASLLDETRTYDSPIEQRIPNVEGTKLVGIIEADGGSNRALLEDKEGYGYILKSGDKVRNGYVLRVEHDHVYFQIFEYGWSRTVDLSMTEF